MFGQLVVEYRKRLGMTQEELADKAGLSVRTIRDLESGQGRVPRPASVRLLAAAFELHGKEREQFYERAAGVGRGSTDAVPGGTSGRVPAQLPLDIRGFVGRTRELGQLSALLDPADQQRSGTAVCVITGAAGIGKTTLAVHWAHRVRDRFPDGQLYVDLRGFDPTGAGVTPTDALRVLLDALRVPAHRVPADLSARSALYRSLTADHRILVLLDNARDTEQVRPLLPGGPGCLVVVTSRDQLASLIAVENAVPVALDLPAPEEAYRAFTHRIGTDLAATDTEAIEEIISRCGRLPLALAIVAARVLTGSTSLAAVATQLRDAGAGLAALTTGDATTDIRAVFSWSYQRLNPATARMFRLLGLHPGPDISADAAASLAGVPRRAARSCLDELRRAHLVTEPAPDRYALHSLLHAYAVEQAVHEEPAPERDAARRRILDHYLHTASAAAELLHPHREQVTLPPPAAGVTPAQITDDRHARAWLTTEHSVLLAIVDAASKSGADDIVWALSWALGNYLDWRGYWQEYLAIQHRGLRAAQRLARPYEQAISHRALGHILIRLGHLDEAETHLWAALDLFTRAGHQLGRARTHQKLAVLYYNTGSFAKELDHQRKAYELYRASDDSVGLARALNSLSHAYLRCGDIQQALGHGQQALAIQETIDDPHGAADTWDTLGSTHVKLGDHRRAEECYQRALDLVRKVGSRYYEAVALVHIGDVRRTAGDLDGARRAHRDALTILEELDHPDAAEVRHKIA